MSGPPTFHKGRFITASLFLTTTFPMNGLLGTLAQTLGGSQMDQLAGAIGADSGVVIANDNAPTEVVLAGTVEAIDAVAARHSIDHSTALDRMDAAGATLTTTETAIFEWCETSLAPEFKQISALIRETAPQGC